MVAHLSPHALPLTAVQKIHCLGANGQAFLRSPQYATPLSHPVPVFGSHSQLNLDREKCMTFQNRFAPYSDEALGVTYLHSYKQWLDQHRNQSTNWPYTFEVQATETLSQINHKAKDYPDWKVAMKECRAASSEMQKKNSALVLRIAENTTWVSCKKDIRETFSLFISS